MKYNHENLEVCKLFIEFVKNIYIIMNNFSTWTKVQKNYILN